MAQDLRSYLDLVKRRKPGDFEIVSKPVDPRHEITASVRAGEELFNQIGCATCHTPSLITARPGTPVNGGEFIVPAALGEEVVVLVHIRARTKRDAVEVEHSPAALFQVRDGKVRRTRFFLERELALEVAGLDPPPA